MFKKLFYTIVLIGVILIFYLSWQTDPNLKDIAFIPSWLSNWTDAYKNSTIRTAVPFFFLGFCIGSYLVWNNIHGKVWFFTWWALVIVVIIAEIGQYFLPTRDVDWVDILWGSVGSAIGLTLPCLIELFKKL